MTLFMSLIMMVMGASIRDVDSCLPADIKPTDVVSVERIERKPGVVEVKKVTVHQKLKQLRAKCVGGKLRDSSGKEIYFYRMVGCWGNPPEDYQEILDRQEKELARLRKSYRVIELTCNPDGEQIH